ncbi:hypothetical protein BVI2075_20005 [Burkholderia vietnamiensis]|nr:hypothetical protein BVI2075_20005 [Burkholderia vietnamiensis]
MRPRVPRVAAGRADLRIRLACRFLRAAADPDAPAAGRRARARRCARRAEGCAKAADRRRRRRAVQPGMGRAAHVRRDARRAGRRIAGRQGQPRVGPSAESRRDRRDGLARRQSRGRAGRRGVRGRHASAGLHHRLACAVRRRDAAEPERAAVRRGQETRPAADRRCAHGPRPGVGGARGLARRRGLDRHEPRPRGRVERARDRADHARAAGHAAVRRGGDRRGPRFGGGRRTRQRARRSGRVRGRHAAGRAAQAVAQRRAGQLSHGLRVLVHGLRNRRRPRREARAARARSDRDRRRRLVHDAQRGTRDVGDARPQDHRRDPRQPRLRLHRAAAAELRRRELQQHARRLRAGRRRALDDRLRDACACDGRRSRARARRGRAAPRTDAGARGEDEPGAGDRHDARAHDRRRRRMVGSRGAAGVRPRRRRTRAPYVSRRENPAAALTSPRLQR